MAKDTKETKEQPKVKQPQSKNEVKSFCGCGCDCGCDCGCIPPMKTK